MAPALQAPVPPTPPTPQVVAGARSAPTAAEMYQAARAQRRELARQLESLEDKRSELSSNLDGTSGADRAGLEARIKEIDTRISSVDQEIASADQAVARAAAIPGAVVPDLPVPRSGPPGEVYFLSGMFMVVVLFPIAFAYARRIWRRSGGPATAAMAPELGERFTRLEQAVDAIAVEVERVGEGQRYLTRALAENGAQRALGAGAASPIELKQREGERVERR